MEASCRHHLLSLHRMVGSVSSRTRQFTNFSEPKQIYWSKATANTFILAFGNIPNIFCSIFLGVNFNYLQKMWGLKSPSRTSRSLSQLFCQSVGLGLKAWARTRFRKLRLDYITPLSWTCVPHLLCDYFNEFYWVKDKII